VAIRAYPFDVIGSQSSLVLDFRVLFSQNSQQIANEFFPGLEITFDPRSAIAGIDKIRFVDASLPNGVIPLSKDTGQSVFAVFDRPLAPTIASPAA